MDSKWVIPRHRLRAALHFINGRPITFAHSGYKEAVSKAYAEDDTVKVPVHTEVAKQLHLLAEKDAKYIVTGKVLDCFEVPGHGFHIIFDVTDKTLIWLIDNYHARGLSLTHAPVGGNIMPYEVTLCAVPRRPRSYIFASSDTLIGIEWYKSRLLSGRMPDPSEVQPLPGIMSAQEAEAEMDVDTAISKLPSNVAAVVAASMAAADARVAEAQEEAEKARRAMEEAEENKTVENKLLVTQIEDLQSLLGKDMCTLYGANHCKDRIGSDDPLVVRQAAYGIVAASLAGLREGRSEVMRLEKILGEKAKKEPERPRKRPARDEEAEVVAASATAMGKRPAARPTAPPAGASPQEQLRFYARNAYGLAP